MMIQRGLQYGQDVIDFIEGKDFGWSQPDWTFSQFTHHWRRENVLPVLSEDRLAYTVTSSKADNGDNRVWKLLMEANHHRVMSRLYGAVCSEIHHGAGQVKPFSKRLMRRLDKSNVSLAIEVRDCLDGKRTPKELEEWATEVSEQQTQFWVRIQNQLRELASEEHVHRGTVTEEIRPEHLLRHIYLATPRHLWAATKDQGHPFSVKVTFDDAIQQAPHGMARLRFWYQHSDFYALNPMNTAADKWHTGQSFLYLGPRAYPYGTGSVIRELLSLGCDVKWDYGSLMVMPAREALVVDGRRGLNFPLPRTIRAGKKVDLLEGTADVYKRMESPWEARRVRNTWFAMSESERDQMRALKPKAWVHGEFSLSGYRFLSSVKLLPVCRTHDEYKHAHRVASAESAKDHFEKSRRVDLGDDLPF